MSNLRTKAEHIVVNVFQVPPGNREAAIEAVMDVLRQPDAMPPFELREMFDAFKMVTISLVQHQQQIDHDLQRVQVLLGLDERFDFVFTKEQLDAGLERQQAQFKLLNTAVAKLHNVGVRQGWAAGNIVDEQAMFNEFHQMNKMYTQTCQQLATQMEARRKQLEEGEDWKNDQDDDRPSDD